MYLARMRTERFGLSSCRQRKMKQEKFVKLVEEALDALPVRFRKRMQNVSVLVEDLPPEQLSAVFVWHVRPELSFAEHHQSKN